MQRVLLLLTAVLTSFFLLTGCQTATLSLSSENAQPNKTTEIKKEVLQDPALVITTAQVMEILNGPDAANYFIVDARPEIKYLAGHVPGAVSIPKPMLKGSLDKLPKDKTIIFYCGGLTCHLSPESAKIAMEAGFTKVKVWYEGQPGWVKAGNYTIIETAGVEKIVMKPSTSPSLLIDSRPALKYQKSFIPSAISLPKAEFELKKGLLPADKSIPLIFYCGGYKCELSHQSAKLALQLGYKKVSVYAAGQPAWKEADLPLWGNAASGVKKAAAKTAALPESIPPAEFEKLVTEGKLAVVDVRADNEFAAAHIPGSINIFDEDFIFKAKEAVAKLPQEGRVVLYCNTGGRAGGAYYAILETDYANKNNLQYLDATINVNADGTFKFE